MGSVIGRLHRLVDDTRDLARQEPHLFRVFHMFHARGTTHWDTRMYIEEHYDAYREHIRSIITDGVIEQEVSPENAHVVPGLLLGALEGAALQLYVDPQAFDADAHFSAIKETTDYLLHRDQGA